MRIFQLPATLGVFGIRSRTISFDSKKLCTLQLFAIISLKILYRTCIIELKVTLLFQ